MFKLYERGYTLAPKACFGKNAGVYMLFLMLFFCFVKPEYVFAKDSPINRIQTSHARALTVEAIKQAHKGKWDAAKEKFAEARDPLASKLYHWLILIDSDYAGFSDELFIRLSHAIRDNPDWPEINKIKVRAESIMPEDLSNSEVLAWYQDFPPQTSYGMERYMDALIIEGRKEEARDFVAQWWARTLTSREQQRDIFKKYGSFLTLEAHKQRFDALMFAKHYDNARAMADVLGQGYPELAKARISLSQNNGGGVSTLIERVPSYLQDDPGLLYERLRWRRKRNLDSGAIEILLNTPEVSAVSNPKDWWEERHIIIRRLLEKGDYSKAYSVAEKHIQKEGFAYAQAQWMAGWLALRFVNKPTEAYERFSALYQKVETPVSKARAAYWAGRTAKELQQEALAMDWYKKAAAFRTVFYGQLAWAALSNENQLPKETLPSLSSRDRQNYEKNELVQAASLFESAGIKGRSESFLYAFLKSEGTPKAYRYAAELAADKGDHYTAVKISKDATKKGLFLTKQSYPTITKQLQEINTAEWALLHALIRQESIFDFNAKSRAGALGLMQLMPATAKHVSKKLNVAYNKEWLTSNPKYNMKLGAAYISELITRYDGNYALAIAAYNAGPGRVDSWVKIFGDPRKREIDLIDWIELIPIYETRNYVQRVMESTYIYRLRLNRIQEQPQNILHVSVYAEK